VANEPIPFLADDGRVGARVRVRVGVRVEARVIVEVELPTANVTMGQIETVVTEEPADADAAATAESVDAADVAAGTVRVTVGAPTHAVQTSVTVVRGIEAGVSVQPQCSTVIVAVTVLRPVGQTVT